jgi:hypothetical protein
MMRRISSNKRPSPLPFPEWVEKKYPRKNVKRSFLKIIGALDLAYLMYRMGTKNEPPKKDEAPRIIPPMPLKVEDHRRPTVKKEIKPRKKGTAKTSKPKQQGFVPAAPELTVEFEHKPESVKPRTIEPAPATPIEPEPLELETEQISEHPAAAVPGRGSKWLDDESLEETDLRKLKTPLKSGNVSVTFETQDRDGEEETVITVNDVSWRVMLPSPALNLSKMLQIVRISYGELYVLGRMALGAMSGEGYVSSDEAARIIALLAAADSKTLELDVQYHDKDKTSKKRGTFTVTIRFEKI